MLILTRKPGESVYIGDSVKITIVEIKGHQIRVGIEAPKDLRIYREEIWEQILEENRQAASGGEISDDDLAGLSAAWGKKASGKGTFGKLQRVSVGSPKPSSPKDDRVGLSNESKATRDEDELRASEKNEVSGPQVVKRRGKKKR